MKKLPKVYQNDLKNVKNNLNVFDSLKDDKVKVNFDTLNVKFDGLSVKDKLKELINQNSYIFNTKVILVFFFFFEECQIAGVVNNHIITMDNRIIKVDSLKDIMYSLLTPDYD